MNYELLWYSFIGAKFVSLPETGKRCFINGSKTAAGCFVKPFDESIYLLYKQQGGMVLQAKDRIVLALDVDTRQEALTLAKELREHVGVFKIGMQLFNSTGPDIVKQINDMGGRVFVDLKFHDIPNTVGAAGKVMTVSTPLCLTFTLPEDGK
jgi:hypothetical protein